jgi:ABC-2 type transport system ATP-binding protein
MADVHDFESQGNGVRFSVDRTDLDSTMERLTDLGIEELTVTPASLEDLFLREYQGAER